ncbi:MAG TPA: LuxR C-terminal-related transcriptional regulator [Verrucomicrobiae bacterium]|nr:LuxR C-terminal-related transcriptional regulator [Verrucomicrobiae bacterium]
MARQSSSSVGVGKFSSLRSRDLNAAARFVRDVSAARGLEQFIAFVLDEMPRLVRSEMTSYNEIDLREGRSVNWVSPAQPEERHEAWLRVMHQHPIVALAQSGPLDRAHRLSDFMTPTQLRNTALYAEHYGPIGGLLDCMPVLWGEGGKVTSIGVHRAAKFSDREQAVMNAVSEPLLRAHENARAITALERRVAGLEQVVGAAGHAVIFLRSDRTLDFATASAFEWLTRYFGNAPAERLPEKLDLWVRHHDKQAQQLLEIPAPRNPLVVERGDRRLVVRLTSSAHGLIVMLEEQLLSIDPRTLSSLGLSSRENAVLAHVANGHSNPKIARLLGISTRTVESHVARICERLGVKNRTAAAARAFQASRAGERVSPGVEAAETRHRLKRLHP